MSAQTNSSTASMQPPLQVAFAAQKAGSKIELDIGISNPGPYWFSLRFPYKEGNAKDFARVRQLTGDYVKDANGALIPSGVPLSIRLVIRNQSVPTAAPLREVTVNPTLASYGSGWVTKRIESVFLQKGTYSVMVESLRSAPELDGLELQFSIARDPKAA